jgi:hypothetical protein
MNTLSEEMEEIFSQAIAARVQCGWTTRTFLEQQGSIAPNVYLWRVAGSGRLTTVEIAMPHPSVKDVVIYRELAASQRLGNSKHC